MVYTVVYRIVEDGRLQMDEESQVLTAEVVNASTLRYKSVQSVGNKATLRRKEMLHVLGLFHASVLRVLAMCSSESPADFQRATRRATQRSTLKGNY
jgi:hypothetical protein